MDNRLDKYIFKWITPFLKPATPHIQANKIYSLLSNISIRFLKLVLLETQS